MQVGQRVGQYEIREVLGRGGMGTVYCAQHVSLEREVAIKFLAPNLSDDEEFLRRFEREARMMARLEHPNLVRVYDYGEQDGTPYLVMERLRGETLRQQMRQAGVREAEAVRITDSVLCGLQVAHETGVIHRDIKPANIFVCADRQHTVKVMDFGIARAVSEARLTGTGAQMGTPEYMSPEQAEGLVLDARSDLYSVGIMLYEMLAGQVPFTAETPLSILHMHVTRTPPPLPEHIGDGLQMFVRRALTKRPDDRFASAEAMLDVLTATVQSSPTLPNPAASPPPPLMPDFGVAPANGLMPRTESTSGGQAAPTGTGQPSERFQSSAATPPFPTPLYPPQPPPAPGPTGSGSGLLLRPPSSPPPLPAPPYGASAYPAPPSPLTVPGYAPPSNKFRKANATVGAVLLGSCGVLLLLFVLAILIGSSHR